MSHTDTHHIPWSFPTGQNMLDWTDTAEANCLSWPQIDFKLKSS